MAEGKVLTGAGLRGQVAGKTALSTVGKSGAGLTYRGYDVQDLAENCQFEDVAYLIFFGELFFMPVFYHIKLTTHNWFYFVWVFWGVMLRCFCHEAEYAEHVTMIGNSNGGHVICYCLFI